MKIWGNAVLFLKHLSRTILDYILPPRCNACGCKVLDSGALCNVCFSRLSFITDPQCLCCGLPFEYEIEKDSLCGMCLQQLPDYKWARAPLHYDNASSALVLGLKHGKRLENAPTLARLMRQAIVDKVAHVDLFVPVPLHRSRLFKRRFNQAAVLASHLSKLTDIPCNVLAFRRTRPTPPQVGLTRGQRQKNVSNAFDVVSREAILNKNIVLVDDVLTTGATVGACSRTLMKSGAKSVSVLTLARVVKTHKKGSF